MTCFRLSHTVQRRSVTVDSTFHREVLNALRAADVAAPEHRPRIAAAAQSHVHALLDTSQPIDVPAVHVMVRRCRCE